MIPNFQYVMTSLASNCHATECQISHKKVILFSSTLTQVSDDR